MPLQHGLVVRINEDFAEVGSVVGSAAELRDALTNLLFNAVDAMPQGGDITVRTRRAGNEIVLEIQDSGTGMSEEVRDKCLEPYFTTKGLQGTGLGLSMVHGIVDRHRGRLMIDSEPGGGTTIRLTLRRAELKPGTQAAPEPLDPNQPRRILCVDDDLRILRALEGMLRQLGHDVTTTNSGAEVIQRIGVERFDVLITDLGMPGVDGREVARNAKRLSPSTRVLLLTGWADRLEVEGDMPQAGRQTSRQANHQSPAATSAGVKLRRPGVRPRAQSACGFAALISPNRRPRPQMLANSGPSSKMLEPRRFTAKTS